MSAIDKVIEVRVKHGPDMDIEDFHPFQGDLKALPKENYEKLKHTILEEGFADPFNLYFDADKKKYFICDGHQRQIVLKGLRAEGYMVPKVPTNIVLARSFEQAKKFVLTFASNYGVLSEESLSTYMIDAGLSLDFLEASVVFPEVSVDYFSAETADLPDLPDGEKTPFQQITFMLHDSQAEIVKNAISKAQQDFSEEMGSSENENKNSNAIAFICQRFLDEQ